MGDEDYPERARIVLSAIIKRKKDSFGKIEMFVRDKELDPLSSSNYSEYDKQVHTDLKKSEIFKIPDSPINNKQVAVMMPFTRELEPVILKIKEVCNNLGLSCLKADDIWANQTIIQDVFDLIYTSEVVIADFTGKNPNVFYEVGIAHTLGKTVLPLTQALSDVPFDLAHHRILKYLPNGEGLNKMSIEIKNRLNSIFDLKGD